MSSHKENFVLSLTRLEEFVSLPITHDRDRAGIIQAFEFTFEQSWKALKEISEAEKLPAPSPKRALQRGVELGFVAIEDEERWIEMLEDRNRTSHVYNQSQSMEICKRIIEQHLPLLSKLKIAITAG